MYFFPCLQSLTEGAGISFLPQSGFCRALFPLPDGNRISIQAQNECQWIYTEIKIQYDLIVSIMYIIFAVSHFLKIV